MYGDMELGLLRSLREQIPVGITVQWHRDGEALVYPYLGEALQLFKEHVTSIVTNGKKLVERFDEILANPPTSICVSTFKSDPDGTDQFVVLQQFLDRLARLPTTTRRPMMLVKIVGDALEPVRADTVGNWERAGWVKVTRRLLHAPQGSHHYRRSQPTIPETGICQDLLSHPSIDWQGGMYLCQRLDAEQRHFLGRIPPFTIDELWNGEPRKTWVRAHLEGRRADVPACAKCEFWGIASGTP